MNDERKHALTQRRVFFVYALQRLRAASIDAPPSDGYIRRAEQFQAHIKAIDDELARG